MDISLEWESGTEYVYYSVIYSEIIIRRSMVVCDDDIFDSWYIYLGRL